MICWNKELKSTKRAFMCNISISMQFATFAIVYTHQIVISSSSSSSSHHHIIIIDVFPFFSMFLGALAISFFCHCLRNLQMASRWCAPLSVLIFQDRNWSTGWAMWPFQNAEQGNLIFGGSPISIRSWPIWRPKTIIMRSPRPIKSLHRCTAICVFLKHLLASGWMKSQHVLKLKKWLLHTMKRTILMARWWWKGDFFNYWNWLFCVMTFCLTETCKKIILRLLFVSSIWFLNTPSLSSSNNPPAVCRTVKDDDGDVREPPTKKLKLEKCSEQNISKLENPHLW